MVEQTIAPVKGADPQAGGNHAGSHQSAGRLMKREGKSVRDHEDYILPSMFDRRVAEALSTAVRNAGSSG